MLWQKEINKFVLKKDKNTNKIKIEIYIKFQALKLTKPEF